MPSRTPDARFAVLDAIRRGSATVVELAHSLRVTDNAVRLHLAGLERDGLIQRRGLVRSGRPGQPAAEYVLSARGEEALSEAYPAVLAALVAALADRLDARALRAVFTDAGARLARPVAEVEGGIATRAAACAELLRSLGGSVEVHAGRGEATLVGAGCPLASAVRRTPETCTLIESLLETQCGVVADQACTHGETPSCRFRVALR